MAGNSIRTCCLFGFRERIRGVMSSVVNRILESFSFVKYEKLDKILLFRTSEHCWKKKGK